jgi:hypothetical protein
MNTPSRERYVLYYLALIDLERVQDSLDCLRSNADEHLRDSLFRDAVVSYAKPFSDNRGVHTKRGLKVPESVVPKELKTVHRELIRIRNQLFAHMDLDKQAPKIDVFMVNGEKHVSFTVAGYGKVYADHLIRPMTRLAKAVHKNLMEKLRETERHV